MDLCLSCKGCTSECPSNVDMASMKAEFLHQYYKTHGVPLRARAFAKINSLNRLGSIFPSIANFFLGNAFTSGMMKRFLNVAPERSLPTIQKVSLRKWFRQNIKALQSESASRTLSSGSTRVVYLFCDEFTNYNDTHIGIKAIQLLTLLGYEVKMIDHPESGRAAISKGLLPMAKKCAQQNFDIFHKIINTDTPLLGIEPSAILTFQDEYPRLVKKENQEVAKELGKHTMLIDEFLSKEIQNNNIDSTFFTKKEKRILLHGHCHQKALSSVEHSAWLLSLPENYTVEVIPSGCCGMAGSFGYEKEHYEVSMQVGELVLFPAVRKADKKVIIAAPGTSCRHQIADGTKRKALHPIEILWEALDNDEL